MLIIILAITMKDIYFIKSKITKEYFILYFLMILGFKKICKISLLKYVYQSNSLITDQLINFLQLKKLCTYITNNCIKNNCETV